MPSSAPIEEPLFDGYHSPSPPPGKYQATSHSTHLAEDNQSGSVYVQNPHQEDEDLYYIFYEEDDTVIEPHVTQPHEGPLPPPSRPLKPEDFFDPIYYQSPELGFVRTLKRLKKKAKPFEASLLFESEDPVTAADSLAPSVVPKRELQEGEVSESKAHYHLEVNGKEEGFQHSIDHTKSLRR